MTNDELRAAFEAHFSRPPFEWRFSRYTDKQAWPGAYVHYHIECAWESWQACHAAMQGEDVRRDGATQNWIELNTKAQSKVESSVLWERFIDGTPLSNDIACWMADFAIEAIDTAMGERHELS